LIFSSAARLYYLISLHKITKLKLVAVKNIEQSSALGFSNFKLNKTASLFYTYAA